MENKGSVRIYADMASQPSRAVIMLCKMAKIPYQVKNTLIFKMQHKAPQYRKLNPYGIIPTIEHIKPGAGNFVLYESHAIMRYLCAAFGANEHWYPSKDIKARAIIDQYLDGHHSNLRRAASVLFPTTFLPMFIGFKAAKEMTDERTIEMHRNQLNKALKIIENNYLGDHLRVRKAKYEGVRIWIASAGKHPSIADLAAFCELDSVNYMPEMFQEIMSKYPRIKAWYEQMKRIPEVKEVRSFLDKTIPKFLKKYNQKKAEEEKELSPKL